MGASATELVASDSLPPCLRRLRSLASAIPARCCSSVTTGRNGLFNHDFDVLFSQLSSHKSAGGFLSRTPQKQLAAWHESSSRLLGSGRSGGSRRVLTFCKGGVADAEADEVDEGVKYKPSPWKLFLRKLRVETKKMNCIRPASAGFQYDALSYAMNFDDGGWQPQQKYFQSPSSRFRLPSSLVPNTLDGMSNDASILPKILPSVQEL